MNQILQSQKIFLLRSYLAKRVAITLVPNQSDFKFYEQIFSRNKPARENYQFLDVFTKPSN